MLRDRTFFAGMQFHTIRLYGWSQCLALAYPRLLIQQLFMQPGQPIIDMNPFSGTGMKHRRWIGQLAQIALGSTWVEVIQIWKQIGLGQKYQVSSAEHHRRKWRSPG